MKVSYINLIPRHKAYTRCLSLNANFFLLDSNQQNRFLSYVHEKRVNFEFLNFQMLATNQHNLVKFETSFKFFSICIPLNESKTISKLEFCKFIIICIGQFYIQC